MLYRKTSQGAHEYSATVTDKSGTSWLYTKQYMGFTKAEALKRFKFDCEQVSLGE
jgi:hypothetical protein